MLVDLPVPQGYFWPAWAGFAIVAAVLYRAYLATLWPKDLDLVREKEGARHFSLQTRLAFYFGCPQLYRDVWDKFSKKGKAVLVPTLGTRKEIFLPHSALKWATSQPPRILGMWEAFNECFQLGHSLGDEKYMIDTWPHLLARHVLTQELDDYIMPSYEELTLAIDGNLGHNTEWQTVDLLDTMRMIVNQVGSRFAVGLPLCRDQTYLRTIMNTIDGVVLNAGATGFMPECVRSIFGSLACLATRSKLSKLEGTYEAEFKRRMALMADASSSEKASEPKDLLQRMLRYAHQNRPEELETSQMTRRMLMANLGFIYQASYAMTNILANVLESDSKHNTIAMLREEAESFLAQYPDPAALWTKENVADMVHADSVMRETLRLNTIPTRAVVRKVMADGVTSPDGVPLPKGAMLSFVSQPMHTDPDLFENPDEFDPFRFVKLRERTTTNSLQGDETASDAGGSWNRHAFLSTSDLLIFGRGRNSCPGRFLVNFQLKMMISYLFSNYEFRFPEEYKGKRPPNRWLLEFMFPRTGVNVQMRRRGTEAAGPLE